MSAYPILAFLMSIPGFVGGTFPSSDGHTCDFGLAQRSGARRFLFFFSLSHVFDSFSAARSQEQKHIIHTVKGWCVHAGFFFGRCIDSWEEELRGARTNTRS